MDLKAVSFCCPLRFTKMSYNSFQASVKKTNMNSSKIYFCKINLKIGVSLVLMTAALKASQKKTFDLIKRIICQLQPLTTFLVDTLDISLPCKPN